MSILIKHIGARALIPGSSLTNDEISELVKQEIERDRSIKIFNDPPESELISPESFLNSPLVNKQRTYGCD